MTPDEYREAVMNDAREYIDENIGCFDNFDECYEAMDNEVTGNRDGSYIMDREKARQTIFDTVTDPGFISEYESTTGTKFEMGEPEQVDIEIRWYYYEQLRDDIEEYYNKQNR